MKGTMMKTLGTCAVAAILLSGLAAWGADAPKEAVADWEKEMNAKLSEPITVEFDGTDLAKALAYFRDRTKVNIMLNMHTGRSTDTPTPRVTLKLDGVQAESALAWTARLAGVAYVVRDQAIYVTPETNVDPQWRAEMQARYSRRMNDLKTGWMRNIEAKLRKKIDVKFQNETVERAAESVAMQSGLNIVVDAESAKTARAVNYEADGMTVENVLKWITQYTGLKYTLRDEVIYIASPANMANLQLETGTAGIPAKFMQPVTFDFKDTDLMRALRQLQQISGVTIEVPQTPGVEMKVTISGEGMALDKAVRLVLDQTRVGYAISYRGDTMVVILREQTPKKPAEGQK